MTKKDINFELQNKIDLLGDEHKQVVNEFLDLFFVENAQAIRGNAVRHLVSLADEINEFAAEKGMTEDLANKLIKEIS